MKSIIHLYIYGMLRRAVNGGNIIHISQIHPVVKWIIRVPKKYQLEIIKELIACGYLKKRSRDDFEIAPIVCKPLSDSLGEPLWD